MPNENQQNTVTCENTTTTSTTTTTTSSSNTSQPQALPMSLQPVLSASRFCNNCTFDATYPSDDKTDYISIKSHSPISIEDLKRISLNMKKTLSKIEPAIIFHIFALSSNNELRFMIVTPNSKLKLCETILGKFIFAKVISQTSVTPRPRPSAMPPPAAIPEFPSTMISPAEFCKNCKYDDTLVMNGLNYISIKYNSNITRENLNAIANFMPNKIKNKRKIAKGLDFYFAAIPPNEILVTVLQDVDELSKAIKKTYNIPEYNCVPRVPTIPLSQVAQMPTLAPTPQSYSQIFMTIPPTPSRQLPPFRTDIPDTPLTVASFLPPENNMQHNTPNTQQNSSLFWQIPPTPSRQLAPFPNIPGTPLMDLFQAHKNKQNDSTNDNRAKNTRVDDSYGSMSGRI